MPFNSFRTGKIDAPLTGELIRQLTAIYELKGKQRLYEQQAPEVLEHLKKSAIIESTESSSRIEGVVASPARVREIVGLGASPKTRSEAEIAGYRDVLSTIHASYLHIQVRPNTILQFHRDLFRLAGVSGGAWKNVDNAIEATLPDGTREVVFRPLPAYLTETAMLELCDEFNTTRDSHRHEDLVLIAAFILDFLAIHPFTDGNGRIARLLTTLLLYQSDFTVARYVSIERIVEKTKESYYASLRASSEGWREGTHSLTPWTGYFLGVVLAAYRELDAKLGIAGMPTKTARVKLAIDQLPDAFTVGEIERACPGVSRPTIKLALRQLRDEGTIEVARQGRGAIWRKRH
jgi:Fic family protein